MYERLSPVGLEIVAFPCNQFGGQEPGTSADIQGFVRSQGVKFPVMAKVDVNGADAHGVYRLLKGVDGSDIRWNFFSKFVVSCDTDQCTIYRHDGAPNPSSLEAHIKELLKGGRMSDL
mmetsp:Transcript_2275/g.6572  ORF Transcript_2275/g.6572 Transcript_2275/m.6572 type:complete len:118 (-) Transcript_2275:220-573(-)